MKIRNHIFILIAIITLWGCESLKVTSDYNGKLDFSNYKTYNFYQHNPDSLPPNMNNPIIANKLNQRRIENAIKEEMHIRGYELSDDPDILVSYYLKVEDKTEMVATTYGSPYYRGYGYYGYYGGYSQSYTDVSTYNYKYGTLIIDLVDRKANDLIWYGAASKALKDNNRNPEATINYVVTKMFYQYRFMAGEAEPVRTIKRK
jgi:hypothetical protein